MENIKLEFILFVKKAKKAQNDDQVLYLLYSMIFRISGLLFFSFETPRDIELEKKFITCLN